MALRLIIVMACLGLAVLPASGQPRPAPPRETVDTLLEALKVAPSEDVARVLEQKIRKRWFEAGSGVATLLMGRGMRDLANRAEREAVDDFNDALVLEPNLTEAFHRRALARMALGDYASALADLQETLRREPRHFAALQTLSRIAEQRGDFKGALAAWKKVLELSPKTPEGEERMKMLSRKVFGEEL